MVSRAPKRTALPHVLQNSDTPRSRSGRVQDAILAAHVAKTVDFHRAL